MNLNINIVDACNLRCPSCPRGRGQLDNTHEEMSPALFRRILEHAKSICELHTIQPYDNVEPLLHSDLPEMIRIGREFAPVTLSTNASFPRANWEAILLAGPNPVAVSISGWTQEVYGRTHQGGHSEVVKEAMGKISALVRLYDLDTKLVSFYHRYPDNLHEEEQARNFARSLGFQHVPLWATTLVPYGQQNDAGCFIGPAAAGAIGRRHPTRKCLVMEHDINIDVHGNATLCAGFTHPVADFLKVGFEELQALRRHDPKCIECRRLGLADYTCRNPSLDWYACKMAGDCLAYRMQRWRHWLFYQLEWLRR